MSTLPSNYPELLEMALDEQENFYQYWETVGQLLGLDTHPTTAAHTIDLYKGDTFIAGLSKDGGMEIIVDNPEVRKRIIIMILKELRNGKRVGN